MTTELNQASNLDMTAAEDFLNLTFEELTQVAVRLPFSADNSIKIESQKAGEVQSKPVDFLNLSFEQLTRLPVRVRTLTDKEKEQEQQNESSIQSSAITLENLPKVISDQSLVLRLPMTGDVTSIEKDLTSESNGSTSEVSTEPPATLPPVVPPAVGILPQFLVVTNLGSGTISVLNRNANATFSSQPTLNVPGAYTMALGDFNSDGLVDLAVANFTDGLLQIFLATGVGTFAFPTTFGPLVSPVNVVTSDFNGDNILDLAIVNYLGNTVSIFMGTGTGSFIGPNSFSNIAATPPFRLGVGDYNRDGILDLAVLNDGIPGSISIFLGTGTGTFDFLTNFPIAGTFPASITTADFNGDGILDLATVQAGTGELAVFLGIGDGSFEPQLTTAGFNFPTFIIAADFNNDGIPDLAIADENDNLVAILLGSGTGSFGLPINVPTNFPSWIAVADFNLDGNTDFAVTNRDNNTVSVMFGNGDGNFQPPVIYPVGTTPYYIGVGFGIGMLPAGVSGEPINLALKSANIEGLTNVTMFIKDMPIEWSLNAGRKNLDGSWSIDTSELETLSIITPFDFIGSKVLHLEISWDTCPIHSFIEETITVYAPSSPIFALPGDNLSGSSYADTFVIKKSLPGTQDKIFNFEIEQDTINLLGFDAQSFSDLTISLDSLGNTIIDIKGEHRIILEDVLCELRENNFRFDELPEIFNSDFIYIGKDAVMPFIGEFENNGTIYVEGKLIVEGNLKGSGKIVIADNGCVELNGHLNQDVTLIESNGNTALFENANLSFSTLYSQTLPELLNNALELI